MRQFNIIDINQIEQYYTVTEEGSVYSKIKNRWLKPQVNNYGYVHYCIAKGTPRIMWIFAHTLVALKYIGKSPAPGYEIDHKDENKQNNHYLNLQWVTRSQNQLKAYARGREHYWKGKTRPSPTLETRIKMSNAKNKRVLFEWNGKRYIYPSIEDAASQLQTYRKKIYRCATSSKLFKGGTISFLYDDPPTIQSL